MLQRIQLTLILQETDYIKASNIKYMGYYFLNAKDRDTWSDHNKVYVIYKATVKSKDNSFKKSDVYLPVEFSNIIKYSDGEDYVSTEYCSISGSSSLSYGWFSSVSGYSKQKDMKNELLTSQKGSFEVAVFGDLDD